MKRIGKLVAVALVALAAVPALAPAATPTPVTVWARQAQFNLTLPYSARLCGEVASGRTPARLAGQDAQISAACSQLKTSFTAAKTAYVTATAALRHQALTAIRQYVQICHQDRLHHLARACRSARAAALTSLDTLRAKVKTAIQAYRSAVNQARQEFWDTVHALQTGAPMKADSAALPAPPSPIPPNSSVPTA